MSGKGNRAPVKDEIVRVRRRQSRAAITRQAIVDAATIEFAASGFESTTTRSIAERAGIPYGLVVYHFKSKFGAWQAVMENIVRAFHDEFQLRMKEVEGADDATRLLASQRAYIRLSAKRPELALLTSFDVGHGSKGAERMDWMLRNIVGRDADEAIRMIKSAQDAGLYIAGDPAHLHMTFVIIGSRIFAMTGEVKRTMNQSPFDEDFVKKHLDLCERLFWRALPEESQTSETPDSHDAPRRRASPGKGRRTRVCRPSR